MKRLFIAFLTLFTLQVYSQNEIADLSKNILNYTDPIPGAKYINPGTTIIFRASFKLNKSDIINSNNVKITGSVNGNYTFSVIRTKDEYTYILKPINDFAPGENVTVKFYKGINTSTGINAAPFSYSFKIKSVEIPVNPLLGLVNEVSSTEIEKLLTAPLHKGEPDGFPVITITQSNGPADGLLLVSNIVFNTLIPNTPYLIIMKNDGTPVFSRQMNGQIFDFNRQPNGNFTYFNREGGKYYELDTLYNLTDSFYTGNGYFTDLHELRVLPNRHALLMSYDKQPVDMSLLIAGGNPNAQVTGVILQEIDENKNVVFQWRSWDHIPITDATHENLLAPEIDYIHSNAIEMDNDGNILLSSRHLDEITKINRSNGNTIWRLGGKKNEFTFTNDPQKFSYQHGIRRLPNGHIIMFDNGNFHSPQVSRAAEYILDETNKQATLFWEYRNTPSIYGYAMGFAQRLENGNTLISWGATNPTLTEIKPDGSKALQITFNTGIFSYRAFKYDLSNGLTGIQPVNNQIPAGYSLSQNYPNPFNPSTTIKFQLPKEGYTKLEIFDELGRSVKTIVAQNLHPGNYEISFSSENYSSGIYYYRLSSNDFSDSRKMLLIK